MARRRRNYRRAARTIYRRARSSTSAGRMGSMKPVIDGVVAGAIGQIATKYIGPYGHSAATLGVGMFRNNNVLKTEGARELGAQLVAQFTGGGLSPYSGNTY
jgi:hypothetical protein